MVGSKSLTGSVMTRNVTVNVPFLPNSVHSNLVSTRKRPVSERQRCPGLDRVGGQGAGSGNGSLDIQIVTLLVFELGVYLYLLENATL